MSVSYLLLKCSTVLTTEDLAQAMSDRSSGRMRTSLAPFALHFSANPFSFSSSPVSPPAPSTSSQSYAAYLADAQSVIRQTYSECRYWTNSYDGTERRPAESSNPGTVRSPRDQVRLNEKISVELGRDPLEESLECCEVFPGSGPTSLGDTSGYLSLETVETEEVSQGGNQGVLTVQLSAEEEQEFWSAVGYEDGRSQSRHKLVSVLARLQHEDRLSMSR